MALLKITHYWSNLLEWGYQHIFGALVWYMSFYNFVDHKDSLASYMHGYDMVQIDGGERPESSKSQLFAIERSEMSERRAPSEDRDGRSP